MLDASSLSPLNSIASSFSTGVFTVGDTGEVSFDYLVDGGKYQGELAMFSLEGIERYEIGSKFFIQEAALRASTNSDLGHIVISDRNEGARFDGSPGERNYNAGQYQGTKKFSMRAGENFGIMLISDGTVQDVLRNPDDAKNRPMFSMPEVNLGGTVQMAQVVDIVADGNSFAFEDLWLNQNSDSDYNDIIFQIQGAKAQVAPLKDLINPGRDWRSSQQGQQLEQYAIKSLEEYEQSIIDPQDLAGNTIDKARKVNLSSSGKSYQGWVGSIDTDDFYSFSLGSRNEFKLSLDGLSSDANVELLDINSNVIQSSRNVGTTAESINTTLESGAYRIRVNSSGSVGSAFKLNLSVTPLIQVEGITITTTGSEETGEIATAQSLPLIEVTDSSPGDTSFSSETRFAGIDGQLNNGTRLSTVIIDTGIRLQHPFFTNRIAHSFDFADNDADAIDDNGHGTNVASIAAGSGTYRTSPTNTVTYRGVAPNANIISLKVVKGGSSIISFSDVEQALQWVVENAETFNIMSVNMSFAGGNHNTLQSGDFNESIAEQTRRKGISDELEALARKNVIVVSASGNSFFDFSSAQGVAYPSADPNSLSIGAVFDSDVGRFPDLTTTIGAIANTTNSDRITPFSQRHETLTTVFAPGSRITGAGLEEIDLNPDNSFNTDFLSRESGTSMAAPHVAGMAVLAQELARQELGRLLTPAEFRQMLRDTGDLIFDGDENNNGRLDIGEEDDNVTNTQRTYRRVNMLALANAILDLKPPSDRQIDLTSKSFDVVGDKFNTGDNFSVAFDIENLGRDNLYPFDVDFYLSFDTTITQQDTLLGNFRINNLNRNSNTGILTQNLTLPSAGNPIWNNFDSGSAYIGMIVDGLNAVGETDENNNSNTGLSRDFDSVQINKQIDLSAARFNVVEPTLNTGDSLIVDIQLQNTGLDDAGSFDVNLYLSDNSDISQSDYSLGSFRVDNLTGNSNTELLRKAFILPNSSDSIWNSFGSGNAQIGMIVDSLNVVDELNENNNANSDTLQINQRRNLAISGRIVGVDHENIGANETIDKKFEETTTLTQLNSQNVLNQQFRWGGEVRVELSLTGIVTDIAGNLQINGTAKLFEGTSEDTNDLDDEVSINIQVPRGQKLTTNIEKLVNEGFFGDDYADITLTFDNTDDINV